MLEKISTAAVPEALGGGMLSLLEWRMCWMFGAKVCVSFRLGEKRLRISHQNFTTLFISRTDMCQLESTLGAISQTSIRWIVRRFGPEVPKSLGCEGGDKFFDPPPLCVADPYPAIRFARVNTKRAAWSYWNVSWKGVFVRISEHSIRKLPWQTKQKELQQRFPSISSKLLRMFAFFSRLETVWGQRLIGLLARMSCSCISIRQAWRNESWIGCLTPCSLTSKIKCFSSIPWRVLSCPSAVLLTFPSKRERERATEHLI